VAASGEGLVTSLGGVKVILRETHTKSYQLPYTSKNVNFFWVQNNSRVVVQDARGGKDPVGI